MPASSSCDFARGHAVPAAAVAAVLILCALAIGAGRDGAWAACAILARFALGTAIRTVKNAPPP